MSERSPGRPVSRHSGAEVPASYPYLSEGDSPRSIRLALIAAVVAHVLLLLVPLPRIEATVQAPDDQHFRVLPTPRFKPPEPPPPEEPPRERARLVPVPDPDPTDPEPLRPLASLEPVLDLPPLDPVIDFPDAPPAPPTDTGPLRIGGPVKAPVRIEAPIPLYPEIARRARIECTVILETVLDESGRITDVEVAKPCPFGMSEAAVEAVERWRYRPATMNGLPVAVYMNLRVEFSLR